MSKTEPRTILAKIHFIDGVILEKNIPYYDHGCHVSDAENSVRLFLQHTPWIKMEFSEFRPASQVARVTWEEVPGEE